jgi:isopenicillin N synthase-like dioxygenase
MVETACDQLEKTLKLPLIDIEPLVNRESSIDAKKSVALEIDKACRSIGFFTVKGHGVTDGLQ